MDAQHDKGGQRQNRHRGMWGMWICMGVLALILLSLFWR